MSIDPTSRYSMGSTYNSAKDATTTREILDHERPQAIPGANAILTHRIVMGETLEGISFRYYGDATKWWIIADVNGIHDPLFLEVGKLIEIPIQANR